MFDDLPFDLLQTRTPLLEIVGRLSLAILFGGAIGIDREFRQKAAGLRTHILVALAAAIFTLITFEIHFEMQRLMDQPRTDVIRIIEAVTAGVTFLAADTIIQSRGAVQGLTTGASMWLAGAVGPSFLNDRPLGSCWLQRPGARAGSAGIGSHGQCGFARTQ
jgi:putative Mg2+ transporter-C (MgtC) family protein